MSDEANEIPNVDALRSFAPSLERCQVQGTLTLASFFGASRMPGWSSSWWAALLQWFPARPSRPRTSTSFIEEVPKTFPDSVLCWRSSMPTFASLRTVVCLGTLIDGRGFEELVSHSELIKDEGAS